MTPEVWDYIFLNDIKLPTTSSIKVEHLQLLKREFQYWYPVDIRVSGKDLIQNHLTFFLYNHCAIWPDDETKWPRGMLYYELVFIQYEYISIKYSCCII